MRSGVFPLSKIKNDMEITMPTKNTEEQQAELFEVQINKTRWLNPDADYSDKLSIRSIELTDAYTRIDFYYKAPDYYVNGGWIQMHPLSFIRPAGSNMRYSLFKAVNIPLAPDKLYFKRCGQHHSYTLYFPALPKDTKTIDIIEREAPGTFFNFYNIDYANWIRMANQVSVQLSKN